MTASKQVEVLTESPDDEGMDISESAERLRLPDLPSDIIAEIFQRCDFETLNTARLASAQCHTHACGAVRSAAWRHAQPNHAQGLAIARLAANAFTSAKLHGLSGGVRGLAMCGDLLASGSKDHVARLWGMRTLGTCFAEFVHPHWVGPVALTRRAGGRLATGCDDGVVRVFSTDTASTVASTAAAGRQQLVELRGQSRSWLVGVGWVGDEQAPDSGDSLRDSDDDLPPLVSCSRDGEMLLWDVGRAAVLHRSYSPPVSVPGSRSSVLVTAFDATGTRAAVGRLGQGPALAAAESVTVYELAASAEAPSSELCRLGRLADGAEGPLCALAWDRGGGISCARSGAGDSGRPTCLASGAGNGQIDLWDVRAPGRPTGPPLENGCAGPLRCLAYSGHVLVAGRDPMLNVWDLRTRRIVQRLRGHANNDALALQVDSAGCRIVCGGRMGGELRAWKLW